MAAEGLHDDFFTLVLAEGGGLYLTGPQPIEDVKSDNGGRALAAGAPFFKGAMAARPILKRICGWMDAGSICMTHHGIVFSIIMKITAGSEGEIQRFLEEMAIVCYVKISPLFS